MNRRDFLKVVASVPVALSLPIEAISKGIDLIQPSSKSALSSDHNLNVSGEAVARYLRMHLPQNKISRTSVKGSFNYKLDKHIEVSILITPEQKNFTSEQHIEQFAIPAAKALVTKIKSYSGRYSFANVLDTPESSRCTIANFRGVSVRAMHKYLIQRKQFLLTFDTILVRKA